MKLEPLAYKFFGIIEGSQIDLPRVNENDFFKDAITIFSQVIGAVSVLILVLAGLRYITSLGDPKKTAEAKDAIVYSLIGLAVSLAAYSIVTLVLNRI